MAWGEDLSESFGTLVETGWRASIVSGVIAAGAGLVTGELPLLVSGALFAAAGTAVATVCACRVDHYDDEAKPEQASIAAVERDSTAEPIIDREAGTRFQDMESLRRNVIVRQLGRQ